MTTGLICLLIPLFVFPLFAQGKLKTVQVKGFDGLKKWFRNEPVESCYIVMKDKVRFYITSYHEARIESSYYNITKKLDRKGYKIKDIYLIVHNHWAWSRFTPTDKLLYIRLREDGFRGLFLLYVQPQGNVFSLVEKDE